MRGLMMDRPLLVSSQILHAERVFADREVVSRDSGGAVHRTTWGEVARRSRRLASALAARGIGRADRIATLAWNNHRHLELYFGVSGMGAVCHTLNPRLHPSELAYILNHAEDRILFTDASFLPLVAAIRESLETVEAVVVLEAADDVPDGSAALESYEDLLAEGDAGYTWPELQESDACSLCYTSGTTGRPRGVLYSHRSTVLHSLAVSLPDALRLGEAESFLPVVPMFHANAWGSPYACAMTGTKLVLPGPGLDGASLTRLMRDEGVTSTAGVPTVWIGLLEHWRSTGERVPSLELVAVGGAAPPASLIREFEEEFGVEVRHGWGMTETSPVGCINVLKPEDRTRSLEKRLEIQVKQGRPIFGVEMRVVDDEGLELPRDGVAAGELQVRGPWVAAGYYGVEEGSTHTEDGWFRTGDVATLDAQGYMRITDRSRDLVKSGGEWISSIDLENAAMGHPGVAHAAVIGVPDEKWGERPVLFAVPRPGNAPDPESVRAFLKGKVPDWWIPDAVVFEDALPVGGTGKVQKIKLREAWRDRAAGIEAPRPPGAAR